MGYGMRAGRLREVVTVQTFTETRDDFGHPGKTYTDAATVRAGVKPLSNSETEDAGKYNNRAMYEFTLRYSPDVDQNSRLVWKGQTFEIIEVLDIAERKRTFKIKAARYGSV